MKRLLIVLALIGLALSAGAQSLARAEFGINLGQAGSFSEYARFGMGASLMVEGFYLDVLTTEAQHRYARSSDTKWHDNKAICTNFGYQIPVLSWLRIMPLVGYAQTNDGITDASKTIYDWDEDSLDVYHPYKVTPGSRKHYFNYGGGLSIQPCRWFSINLIGTRHALYGGIAFDFMAFARDGQ
ncbi:MAG: hypothetical protein J6X77_01350 [Bacteroidales bacterium]|nr:hypothetical protein [Bacteroidales bacterium]